MKMSMKSKNDAIGEILSLAPVVPVLSFDNVETAVAVSQALVDGGLPVIEITLRTPVAMECIAAVMNQVDGAIVGAGTVMTPNAMTDCVDVGCQFLVSPGATVDLIEANKRVDVPLLPGVATPSEAMGLMAEGYRYLKFFPAQQAGGAPYLKALGSVLKDIRFCPTGGLNPATALDYLALDNVVCVGGSWVAPAHAVVASDWDAIRELAQKATTLGVDGT